MIAAESTAALPKLGGKERKLSGRVYEYVFPPLTAVAKVQRVNWGIFFSLRLTCFHDIFRAADKHPRQPDFSCNSREALWGPLSTCGRPAGMDPGTPRPSRKDCRLHSLSSANRAVDVLNLPSSEELAIFGFCQRNFETNK